MLDFANRSWAGVSRPFSNKGLMAQLRRRQPGLRFKIENREGLKYVSVENRSHLKSEGVWQAL